MIFISNNSYFKNYYKQFLFFSIYNKKNYKLKPKKKFSNFFLLLNIVFSFYLFLYIYYFFVILAEFGAILKALFDFGFVNLGILALSTSSSLFDNFVTEVFLLADEGAAIAKACNDLGFEFLFKCYRHLIEKFGSSSVLGILVRKLLFFKDQELFEKYWNDYKNSIIDILQKSSIHHIKKFEEIFGCSFDPKTETLTEPNFNFQSIWRRMEDGISTCSNHSESCHSVLNRQTKSLKNFHKKFKTLLEFLVNRELNALKRPNLKNALKKFNDFFEKFSSTANIDEMDCSSCQKNSFIQYTKSLFRDFPCFHELSEFKFNEFPPFQLIPTENPFNQAEIIENDRPWYFPQITQIIYILDDKDKQFLSEAGSPDTDSIQKLLKDIPKDHNSAEDLFINLFIHFSRLKNGYYSYKPDEDFLSYCCFYQKSQREAESYLREKHYDNLIERSKDSTTSKEFDKSQHFKLLELLEVNLPDIAKEITST